MTPERLASYVGNTQTDTANTDFLSACVLEAAHVVARYAAGEVAATTTETTVTGTSVPDSVLDRAVLEVAADLYYRKSAPSGIAQYATDSGGTGAVRIARDPIRAAYDLLRPYLTGGFA